MSYDNIASSRWINDKFADLKEVINTKKTQLEQSVNEQQRLLVAAAFEGLLSANEEIRKLAIQECAEGKADYMYEIIPRYKSTVETLLATGKTTAEKQKSINNFMDHLSKPRIYAGLKKGFSIALSTGVFLAAPITAFLLTGVFSTSSPALLGFAVLVVIWAGIAGLRAGTSLGIKSAQSNVSLYQSGEQYIKNNLTKFFEATKDIKGDIDSISTELQSPIQNSEGHETVPLVYN